ncbi:MAG TPA: BTAD domain-containing putative transcriptional regulator [Gaiellaceae bacterium]|nr:BTAD domain-containing putative transcriptional regulator [Gaiellaceae bacterium]
MADHGTRVQLCGKLIARIDGRRVDAALPGRQGRLAFAYLTLNRHRVVTRSALIDAIWPAEPPALVDTALNALISKLRGALGSDAVGGRGDVRLVLSDAWVDVEAAAEAIHRAEGAGGRAAWAEVWGPARVALHIVRREFLPGESADWVEDERRALAEVELRALECIARSSLELGPNELESAVRSGRDLVRLAPHRESGHRFLMRALAAEGNDAEALGVYERLRVRLREDLGTAPSAPTQELYRALLG